MVEAAARHDLGKADPRFQAMLNGGLPVLASDDPAKLLAKSGMDPGDRAAFARAAALAKLPRGFRHEALSAVAAAAAEIDVADRELLVHLIAAHHGRSRPLLPPVVDEDPQHYQIQVNGRPVPLSSEPSIDWEAPSRFAVLNRRYGFWGLAMLETIVRLVDIACSEEGT